MKPRKDIFDLIKDNQHKLDEVPSDRTWRRLEQRLDYKTQLRPRSLFRSISWAAAIAAIAVMAVVISLVFTNTAKKNETFAMAEKEPMPKVLEELPDYSELATEAARMEAFRRKYENRLSNPIAEGEGNKRLVAQTFGHTKATDDDKDQKNPSDSAKTNYDRGI